MQQAETQEQFSFIFHNAQNPQTQFSIFQQSAIFGQDIRETPCQQDTQYHPATPKQHLINILESFGSILAKYMALQIIGIPSTLKQSIEYLNNNIQDLKMVIYNAQVMFESKNQSNEFEQAREEQCIQIQAIIDQIKDDYCKQALSKVLGKIEEVRFPSQYILKISPMELLETETIYFQVIEKDPSTKTFVDLIHKDSIIIAQQLFPHVIVLSLVFKEVLKLDLIHQIQQNSSSLQKLISHIQQLSKEQEISSYCSLISRIYPQIQEHFQELEDIKNKTRDFFQQELSQQDKEILQLLYDKQSIYVQQFPGDKYLPEEICELIQLTYFLITQGQNEGTFIKITAKIQNILSDEKFKQYSFIFDLVADCVHSSQLKLLFYGYVECIFDIKLAKFTKHLQTDLITMNQLSKKSQTNLNEQQLQQLKDMLCITRRQNLQFLDFIQIINSAGQMETLVAAKQQEALQETTNELDNQLFESHQINELIINKEPSALQIRIKKLKFIMELFLRYYKVSSETLQKLFLYYDANYENKQSSTIFQKQKAPIHKELQSTVKNQKESQKWIDQQNQILSADVLGTEKNYYRPSIYKIFKGLTNQQTNASSTSLQKILRSFQAKYQSTYANQIQSDFVNLLKEIMSYQKDKQVIFETNFRKFYKKEFKNQLMELPQLQFESVAYALKLIQSIENQQQENN